MALPREHLLDELATSYVQIVAAAAGATIAVSRLDYGVDGTLKHIVAIHGNRFVESGFPVDFQLKGTTTSSVRDGNIVYDLRARNYDLLAERPPEAVPYYLFLVCFERDEQGWIVEEPERLILSAKAFWWISTDLRSENTSTVRIRVPIVQALTVSAMKGILESERQT